MFQLMWNVFVFFTCVYQMLIIELQAFLDLVTFIILQ